MKKNLLLFCAVLICFTSYSQLPPAAHRIDSLLSYLHNQNCFSGSVCIEKGTEVIYAADFNKFPKHGGQYRIGSVSKIYTAIIIYQLIEEGKLAMNTTLDRFFPTIRHAQEITIEKMLSHTSGIFNITELDDYYPNRTKHYSRQEIIEMIAKEKPAFKPGKDCYYSNSNYILLGYIIEDLTGKSYGQNLTERITIPLSINSTYCEDALSDRSLREQSYRFDGVNWTQDMDTDPSLPFAAGAVISTPTDMCEMIRGLFYGKLISDTSLVQMKTLANRATGHGLFKTPLYEKIGWGHTGRIDEFRSVVSYFPEDSLSLAITTNGMYYTLNGMALGILSAYYDMKYDYPEFKTVSNAQPPVEAFAGNYKAKLLGITVARFNLQPSGSEHLTMRDGKAGSKKSRGETVVLERREELKLASREYGWEMTFVKNKKGKIKYGLMKQGKLAVKCRKA